MEIAAGTRVLLTGASRGIGRAIAGEFAARGCAMGLVARSADELETLAGELPGDGHAALTADVGDAEDLACVIDKFRPVDVAVANAGIAEYAPFPDMELEAIERMTRVNWLGTVYTVRAVLPGMLERGRGHIVIVSSGAGLRSFPEAAVYGATKSAQRGFGEALRHELGGTGVSLTLVYPGEVRSSIHDHERDRLPEWRQHSEEADPEPLARQVVEAVEGDVAAVYYPKSVRALRLTHGISPRLADRLLRRVRGRSAAPRRD